MKEPLHDLFALWNLQFSLVVGKYLITLIEETIDEERIRLGMISINDCSIGGKDCQQIKKQ